MIIILTIGYGTGTCMTEAHIIDPVTMTEAYIDDPRAILFKNVKSKIKGNTAEISAGGKTTTVNIEKMDIASENLFSAISFQNIRKFDVVNDELQVSIGAQISPAAFIGEVQIIYIFKDNMYQAKSIEFNHYASTSNLLDVSSTDEFDEAYPDKDAFLNSPEGHDFQVAAWKFTKACLSGDSSTMKSYLIDPESKNNHIYTGNKFNDVEFMILKLSPRDIKENSVIAEYEFRLKGEDYYHKSIPYITVSLADIMIITVSGIITSAIMSTTRKNHWRFPANTKDHASSEQNRYF